MVQLARLSVNDWNIALRSERRRQSYQPMIPTWIKVVLLVNFFVFIPGIIAILKCLT